VVNLLTPQKNGFLVSGSNLQKIGKNFRNQGHRVMIPVASAEVSPADGLAKLGKAGDGRWMVQGKKLGYVR
jgi:hypothetical protein